ncbi:MAG TPA: alpha/beta hydrolase [Streptosporangiaceae bacterium]|nr:alpha/beta hydrolase [Streptosporangiaceae bacterium]
MTTLSTSAGTVAYDAHGSGDPIVLLPSAGHDHHDYDEVRELIPGRFRTISIDWPGHGQSPRPGRCRPPNCGSPRSSRNSSTRSRPPTSRPQNRTPAAKEQQQ